MIALNKKHSETPAKRDRICNDTRFIGRLSTLVVKFQLLVSALQLFQKNVQAISHCFSSRSRLEDSRPGPAPQKMLATLRESDCCKNRAAREEDRTRSSGLPVHRRSRSSTQHLRQARPRIIVLISSNRYADRLRRLLLREKMLAYRQTRALA